MSWGRGGRAVRRLSDRVGGGGGALSVTYIEFATSGTLANDAVGIRSGALPADGQAIGGDAAGIQWIGSTGNINHDGGGSPTVFATGKTWTTSNRPGIAFGYLPAGNAELLSMLGITGVAGDGYAFFFKDGVYQGVAVRLIDYLSSPVRPAAHLASAGTGVNITLKAAVVDWTGSPILLSDVSPFATAPVWVDENTVVLSNADKTAAVGSVANFTPVRTDANGEFAF